jgi:hypothetical protein
LVAVFRKKADRGEEDESDCERAGQDAEKLEPRRPLFSDPGATPRRRDRARARRRLILIL